jgi:predicted transcriptional regulator
VSSRKGNPSSGVVRRSQLRRPSLTVSQQKVLAWLLREGEAESVDAVARAVALSSTQAYLAVAGLLDRGYIVLVGATLKPVRRVT